MAIALLLFGILLAILALAVAVIVASGIVGSAIHRIETEVLMYRNALNEAIGRQSKKS